MDKTEQAIRQFMYDNYPKGAEMDYLDDWIKARDGNIIQVFIEYLEVHLKADYNTEEEKEIIETFRCYTPVARENVKKIIDLIYEYECERRKAKQ